MLALSVIPSFSTLHNAAFENACDHDFFSLWNHALRHISCNDATMSKDILPSCFPQIVLQNYTVTKNVWVPVYQHYFRVEYYNLKLCLINRAMAHLYGFNLHLFDQGI